MLVDKRYAATDFCIASSVLVCVQMWTSRQLFTVATLAGGPAPPRAFTDPLPETVDLEDGVGERCGVHERCWELAGKCEFEDIKGIAQGESWQELEKKYHAQLFDFQRMREKDEAWMIVDPETGSEEGQRNKARILQMLGKPA